MKNLEEDEALRRKTQVMALRNALVHLEQAAELAHRPLLRGSTNHAILELRNDLRGLLLELAMLGYGPPDEELIK